MRLLVVALVAAIAVGSIATDNPNSEHVAAATHEPNEPARGQPVTLRLETTGDNITGVRAIYCRVQSYACAPALNLTPVANATWEGVIPWNSRFFQHVRDVGYEFDLTLENGTSELSPTRNYPAAPDDLPDGADTYYFYRLPADAKSPAPTSIAALVGLVVIAWRLR